MSVDLGDKVVKAADYDVAVAGGFGGGLELALRVALSTGGCLELKTERVSRAVSGGCQ